MENYINHLSLLFDILNKKMENDINHQSLEFRWKKTKIITISEKVNGVLVLKFV